MSTGVMSRAAVFAGRGMFRMVTWDIWKFLVCVGPFIRIWKVLSTEPCGKERRFSGVGLFSRKAYLILTDLV